MSVLVRCWCARNLILPVLVRCRCSENSILPVPVRCSAHRTKHRTGAHRKFGTLVGSAHKRAEDGRKCAIPSANESGRHRRGNLN